MAAKHSRLIFILALLVGFVGPAAARSQVCLDYGDYLHPVVGLNPQPPDYCMNGCFSGQYLLLAMGWGGMTIVDVSDPAAPQVIGSTPLDGNSKDVVLAGDIAYVASSRGMHIVDVSSPALPMLLDTRDSWEDCVKVKTVDNRVYLLSQNVGMYIFEIADPANPLFLGSYHASSGVDIAIEGQTAYLVSYGALHVIDVSDPTLPVKLGEAPTAAMSYGMTRSGFNVFVAVESRGIEVFNVSDPADPTSLGVTATMGHASDVAVAGEIVYVTNSPQLGIQAFDAADPASLSLLWSMDTRGSSESLIADGGLLCVFQLGWGFQLLDISAPAAEVVAREVTPGALLDAAYHDHHCYLAEGTFGLQVFDVSDPGAPSSVRLHTMPAPITRVLVADGIAYLAQEWEGVRLVDVSNPAVLVDMGWFNTFSNPRDMFLQDGLLYIADDQEGLTIADVSDPTAPQLVGREDTPDQAYGVDVEGDYAYVADNSSGLQVIDVSSPGSPVVVGSLALDDFSTDVEVVGHLAFVTDSKRGRLTIVDVSLPTYPALIQRVVLPNVAVGVKVDGSVVYVSCEGGGLVLVDILDPAAARIIGCLPSEGSTNDIALSDTHVFIADGEGGLAVAARQCLEPSPVPDQDVVPSAVTLDGVFPNPFNPRTTISFTLDRSRRVSLDIFDPAGRLVRALVDGVRSGRSHEVVWDGKDDAGRGVPSAIYIVRLKAGDVVAGQKILLIR